MNREAVSVWLKGCHAYENQMQVDARAWGKGGAGSHVPLLLLLPQQGAPSCQWKMFRSKV